jgi:flagellar hook-length control protein FliK
MQKVVMDPAMLEAINIARHDAVKELQNRVSMMLNLNNKEAEIRLDPPELGSLQIRIRTDSETAQVNFVVQNQQAKELLEQSLPKLREMLAEQGINLGESSIEHGSAGQQDNNSGSGERMGSRMNSEQSDEVGDENLRTTAKTSSSAIDYYA